MVTGREKGVLLTFNISELEHTQWTSLVHWHAFRPVFDKSTMELVMEYSIASRSSLKTVAMRKEWSLVSGKK